MSPRQYNKVRFLAPVNFPIVASRTGHYMNQNRNLTVCSQMRKLGTEDPAGRKQVYCIVRVYNLLSDKIGIRIYIDPWRFRDRQLEFSPTDKWKVKPVNLASSYL
jgi:hypothetical protein